MSKDFFSYGTLMCEDIMLAVTGHHFSRTPGVLHDYRRRTVKGEAYSESSRNGAGLSKESCTATYRITLGHSSTHLKVKCTGDGLGRASRRQHVPRGVHLCCQAGIREAGSTRVNGILRSSCNPARKSLRPITQDTSTEEGSSNLRIRRPRTQGAPPSSILFNRQCLHLTAPTAFHPD